MAHNQDPKGYAQSIPPPMSPAPEYHNLQPMGMGNPSGSPPPMHTPPANIGQYQQQQPNMGFPLPSQSPPPMAHQQQPMMYQQHPNGMNYQQQPIMMQHDPNQQPMHQQQQMYGQSPPQQIQGGTVPGQHQHGAQQTNGNQFKTVTAIPNLGMGPSPVDCPSCGKRGITRVSYHPGNTTHIWAFILFCFTLCLCFIPYMMNSLKDVQHNCGNCGVLLATWHKSGAVDVHLHG